MCTLNNDLETLDKIRKKGHKLISGFKKVWVYRDNSVYSAIYSHQWEKGWNYAEGDSYKKLKKIKPYGFYEQVNASFHVYLPNYIDKDIRSICGDRKMVVWFYADEVTSCESCEFGKIITVSKVFIKKLPTKTKSLNIILNSEKKKNKVYFKK